jgi:hypothetical protein
MSASKYVITPDYLTIASQIAAALTDFYGAGVTIHYADGTNLVFSCPAICDKVIKMLLASSQFQFYCGNAWTSGTTITNSVTIQGESWGACVTDMYLILSDEFFLFVDPTTPTDPSTFLVAKTTDDTFFILTTVSNTSSAYSIPRYTYETAAMTRVYPLPLICGSNVKHPDGYLLKMPLLFIDANTKLMLNTDGTPLTIEGLYITPTVSVNIFDSSDVFVSSQARYFNNQSAIGPSNYGLLVELSSGA